MPPTRPIPSAPPRVALLIETSNAYSRGLLAGIADYVQSHAHWSIFLPESTRAHPPAAHLRGWKPDGLLIRAESPAAARAALSLRRPLVDLSAAELLPNHPAVHSDVRAEAALAFHHLRDRGFQNLGFCGVSNYRWVRWQHAAFQQLANAANLRLHARIRPLRLSHARSWSAHRTSLIAWLRKLPKPVGIFACYDLLGQQLLDACRAARIKIPDEVAVIGVDDDAVRCSLSEPPLSSVAPDTRRIGFLAAQLLDQLMAGRKIPPGMRLVPPLGLSARRSTDALAIPDPDIAAALRFIRDHACQGITVETLLHHLPLSRRSLETRFRRALGRTPHAEILRCRIERAKLLLATTDLPIKSIAARVAAGTPEYLSVLFQRTEKTTPSAYRDRTRR
ncbi:MAG: substrate-binding domain-containing protein [Phycisphaerae bacterium]